MKYEEFRKLKHLLNPKPDSCKLSYHNKHVDNSGNFGYVIFIGKSRKIWKHHWFALHGIYDSNHEVISISFGKYRDAGESISTDISLEELAKMISRKMQTEIANYIIDNI